MLLINLTKILYNLKNFRAFVLKLSKKKPNVLFMSNNTITFSVTNKDIRSQKKLMNYENFIFSYNELNFLDEVYQTLRMKYPAQKIITKTNENLFANIFSLLKNQNKKIRLSGIILKRQKKNFDIRVLGLLGRINFFTVLHNFTILWLKKNEITYTNFVRLMLGWLQHVVIVNVNYLSLNFLSLLKKPTVQNYKKNSQKEGSFKPLLFTYNIIH